MPKNRSIPARTLAALAVAAALATPAAAQTTLALNAWAGPTHLLTTEILVGWAKEVEKASNGRIKYTVLPKAVAAPAGTVDALRDGLADVSYISHGLIPGRFALTKLVEFPSMGANGEISSVVYQRIHEKYLAQADEHKGVKVLCMFTQSPGHIWTTGKRQVLKLADLSGIKLRIGGGAVSDLMQAFGATSVVRSASDSYELISNGIVDGTLVPYETIASYKLENMIRYGAIVPSGLYSLSFAVLMSEKKFNAMSKEDQAVINSLSGEKYARMAGQAWDVKDKVGIDVMTKSGVKVTTVDAAFVNGLAEKSKPIEEEWVKVAKQRGVDGALVLKEFREQTAAMAKK